jgi:hypothetical protein
MLMANSIRPNSFTYLLDAPHSRFWEAEGLQRGRKLQRLTLCYKHGSRQGRIFSAVIDLKWQVL